jgi:hypothetical protein
MAVAVDANSSVIPNTFGPREFELNARLSPKSAARDANNKEKEGLRDRVAISD